MTTEQAESVSPEQRQAEADAYLQAQNHRFKMHHKVSELPFAEQEPFRQSAEHAEAERAWGEARAERERQRLRDRSPQEVRDEEARDRERNRAWLERATDIMPNTIRLILTGHDREERILRLIEKVAFGEITDVADRDALDKLSDELWQLHDRAIEQLHVLHGGAKWIGSMTPSPASTAPCGALSTGGPADEFEY